MKPNFSELARYYGMDRRTVKKYYDGYEGSLNKKQSSMLDQYYDLIRTKLGIRTTVKAVYEYLIDQGFDISYSNFNKYISPKALSQRNPERASKI